MISPKSRKKGLGQLLLIRQGLPTLLYPKNPETMKLKKTMLIGLLIVILLLSIIIERFLSPMGIFALPIIISLTTSLIIFTDNGFTVFFKSILSYLCIGLNDVGIKIFAGIHDNEGIGLIHILLFIGLLPCLLMLLINAFRDKRSVIGIKILSVLIFMVLIYVHLKIFETLGVKV